MPLRFLTFPNTPPVSPGKDRGATIGSALRDGLIKTVIAGWSCFSASVEKTGKLRQSELLSLFICVPLARFLLQLVQRRTRPWHEPANLLRLCNTESFCHMDKTCLCVLVIFMLWYGVSQARYPQKQVQTSQGNPDLRIKSFFCCVPIHRRNKSGCHISACINWSLLPWDQPLFLHQSRHSASVDPYLCEIRVLKEKQTHTHTYTLPH